MRTTTAAVIVGGLLCVRSGPQSMHTLAQRDEASHFRERSAAAVSAGGRFVAFASYARLAPADTNDLRDIYVLDRTTGQVTFEQDATGGLIADCSHPRISGEGRFLVYERLERSAGVPMRSDVVLRDRRDGTLAVVSVGRDGVQADGMSSHPGISQDGGVVVFSSSATNLVPGPDENGSGSDIYLFDTSDRSMRRVSVDGNGRQSPTGISLSPATNGDGRIVAFVSTADLDGTGSGASSSPRRPAAVFVRDRTRNLTTRVDMSAGSRVQDAPGSAPAISADGRYVAFVSAASNLSHGDRNRSTDVFVVDLRTGALELVSRSAGSTSAANGPSGSPALSRDGRFVVFQSEASDLLCAPCAKASEDVNLLPDVYLFDRQRSTMVRVSGDATGGWMEPSVGPAVADGGELVAFSSRHPIDGSDDRNDWDLFLYAPSGSRIVGPPGERAHGLHHRHQAHALSHRDILPEDALDDAAVDARDFGRGRTGERLVENRRQRPGRHAGRVFDREVQLQRAIRLLQRPDVRVRLALRDLM
jgi:Tol biopolymer transport system component